MAYKLIHVVGNSYMLEGPVNLGVYHRGEGKCTLIDSGLDKNTGKRAMNILKEKNMEIDSIINTHSHADHVGGNAVLQKRLECDIYASKIESAIIENPIIEPLYLFGSAPPDFLKNKFLMAKPSKVTKVIEEGTLYIETSKFEIINLPGHSLEHIGVVTSDGVFYTGDAYISKDLIEKHGFPFLQDIDAALRSLGDIATLDYSYYVPSHGILDRTVKELIQSNIDIIEETIHLLLENLNEPASAEELSRLIFKEYQINQKPGQYYLTWVTLAAYLAYLYNRGSIEWKFEDHQLKWQKSK